MNQTVTCDAVRLEGAQRLTFLPDLFGGDFMTSEASVYAYAQRYCPEYQGILAVLPAAGRRRIYGA